MAVTDAFMDALAKGEDYDLINPHSGEVTQRLSAREVFDRIVRAAWRTGDPGMVFIDRINASPANPTPELGTIEATNPCGEQPLLPNEACNLGSLNVSKFARQDAAGEWSIDWDEMERVVRLAVRFLDDVIEMNPYPLPQIDETVKSNRRIGLGIMGWADLLFTLGIPYDSQEAIDLADRLMLFVKETSHDQCGKLAEERGPFPNWNHSIYRNVRPMRNSTVTTIAPTGTISMIAGCSSGHRADLRAGLPAPGQEPGRRAGADLRQRDVRAPGQGPGLLLRRPDGGDRPPRHAARHSRPARRRRTGSSRPRTRSATSGTCAIRPRSSAPPTTA